jgi:MFS family permease
MSVKRDIRLLTWFNFLINFNFITPIIIIYFERVTGSFALATSIFAVITISAALLEVPTGVFSDMVGRKKTIVLGTTFALLSLVSYTLGNNYWIFILGAIFHGGCKACFSGNNDAYLHNLLATEKLHEKYHHYRGKLDTLHSIGTSLGALIGGFLAYRSFGLLWISLIPMVIALVISMKLTNIQRQDHTNSTIFAHLKEALLEMKKNDNLRLLSFSEILSNGFGPITAQFQTVLYNFFWPLWAVGIITAVSEWITIPGTFFSGKVIEKIGAYNIMVLNTFYSILANSIAVVIPTKISPVIISSSVVLWGPADVAISSQFQKEFSERQRATIASLNSLASSILFAVGISLMGIFADHFGPLKAFLLTQLFVVSTLLINWKLYQNNKHHVIRI